MNVLYRRDLVYDFNNSVTVNDRFFDMSLAATEISPFPVSVVSDTGLFQ